MELLKNLGWSLIVYYRVIENIVSIKSIKQLNWRFTTSFSTIGWKTTKTSRIRLNKFIWLRYWL